MSNPLGTLYLIALLKYGDYLQRRHAAQALDSDVRAVKPLIAALKDSDEVVRAWAARGLEKLSKQIEDPKLLARVTESLITVLKDRDADVRQIAAQVLGNLGVRLKTTALRPRVVESLIALLQDNNEDVRRAAAESLRRLGWHPSDDENGASYWVAHGHWRKCINIGAPAVRPLIAALHGGMRKAAAETLVSLYKSGRLDKASTSMILARREEIISQHSDEFESCGHSDIGIGVDFPL